MNEEGQLNDMKNKILVCSDSKSLKESIRIILGNEYQLISGSFLKDFKEVKNKYAKSRQACLSWNFDCRTCP